jgi:hypothetical protein
MPSRSPGDGSGAPKLVTTGITPAQVSRAASSESSSLGPGSDLDRRLGNRHAEDGVVDVGEAVRS